jgi:two-component system KDP operon response regulator KdpE
MRLPTILIVDSERKLRRMLHATLVTRGYAAVESRSGENALKMIKTTRPDLILLDINLPGVNGIDMCRQLRHSCDAPIIVVSARSAQHEKVFALDAGADDYVVKPFEWEELLARIRAFLRRYLPSEALSSFAGRDIAVDFEHRQVTVRSRTVHLGPKEFHLLKYLVAHNGKAVAHRELFHALWGPKRNGHLDNLRVVINQLRKKIETDPAHPRFIQTEPSVGYRFQAPKHATRENHVKGA